MSGEKIFTTRFKIQKYLNIGKQMFENRGWPEDFYKHLKYKFHAKESQYINYLHDTYSLRKRTISLLQTSYADPLLVVAKVLRDSFGHSTTDVHGGMSRVTQSLPLRGSVDSARKPSTVQTKIHASPCSTQTTSSTSLTVVQPDGRSGFTLLVYIKYFSDVTAIIPH